MESGQTPPIPFNIFKDIRYHHVKVVENETTFQLSIVGLGKLMNKSNILSIEKKQRMLAQATCQPTSACSLNLKFGYFYMQNLLIKGCFQFCNVDFGEFNLVSMPTIIVLRFCQSVSKNWEIDITWCFVDRLRPVVDYLVVDVIVIVKELVHHHLTSWLIDKPRLHLLFLQSKPKWRFSNDA